MLIYSEKMIARIMPKCGSIVLTGSSIVFGCYFILAFVIAFFRTKFDERTLVYLLFFTMGLATFYISVALYTFARKMLGIKHHSFTLATIFVGTLWALTGEFYRFPDVNLPALATAFVMWVLWSACIEWAFVINPSDIPSEKSFITRLVLLLIKPQGKVKHESLD